MRKSLEIARNSAFTNSPAGRASSGGWCDFWRGERTQGIAKMTEAMEKLNAVNSFLSLPWRLIVLGEMKAEIGETEAAETVVEQALESANLSRERWCLPEVIASLRK
jgi:hypothetical protein